MPNSSELLDHASKINELTVQSKIIYLETFILAIKKLAKDEKIDVNLDKLIVRKGKYCAINYKYVDDITLQTSKYIWLQTKTS